MNMQFMGPMPEEMKRELERQMLEAQVAQNEMWDFLTSLTADQLMFIRSILEQVVEEPSYGHNMRGVVAAIFRLVHHDRCGGCGKNHDEAILNEAREELSSEKAATKSNFEPVNDEVMAALMETYNLTDGPNGMVTCKGCGLTYPDLDDRMLRAPGVDGCHGCQEKSAHG